MKESTKSDFKVGLFVFIALAIFISTVFWAKGLRVRLSLKDYVAYFPKVSGLNEGDPVNVNGVRKGEIEKIQLEGDSVKILFNLDKGIDIKRDYEIYVASTELTGGKVLYIEPGKDQAVVPEGQPLYGAASADFGSLMKSVDEITVQVKDLITEFSKSNENLNSVLTNVNGIVGDNGLRSDIKNTVGNLQTASVNLNQLLQESRTGIGGLTGKASMTMENLDLAIGNNSKELEGTLKDIRSLTTQVDTLVANLNVVVTGIRSDSSTVGKLLTDDEFYTRINKTLLEIEKLSKSIRTGGFKINLF